MFCYQRIIIDGYNLLYHMSSRNSDMSGRRHALLRLLELSAGGFNGTITLVFDGNMVAVPSMPVVEKSFVTICYSPPGTSADAVIEQMVTQAAKPAQTLVVTSDLAEQHCVTAAGAQVMSCDMFLLNLQDWANNTSQDIQRFNRRSAPAALGALGDLCTLDGIET